MSLIMHVDEHNPLTSQLACAIVSPRGDTMDRIHVHQHTNEVVNRLSRIEGHIRPIKRMLKEGRPCPDVLIQLLAAVKSAIGGLLG